MGDIEHNGAFKFTEISSQYILSVSNGVDYALFSYLEDIGCSVTFLQQQPVTHWVTLYCTYHSCSFEKMLLCYLYCISN